MTLVCICRPPIHQIFDSQNVCETYQTPPKLSLIKVSGVLDCHLSIKPLNLGSPLIQGRHEDRRERWRRTHIPAWLRKFPRNSKKTSFCFSGRIPRSEFPQIPKKSLWEIPGRVSRSKFPQNPQKSKNAETVKSTDFHMNLFFPQLFVISPSVLTFFTLYPLH